MPITTLALKDIRLLARDTRALVILLAMPLVFILVLGLSLGEGFGQKPDERLRISVVNLDRGLPNYPAGSFPGRPWSAVVLDDLATTAGIRVELLPDRATAERLTNRGRRSAVLVLGPKFSEQVERCSFLSDGDPPPINPFYRDGVSLAELDAELLTDPTQQTAASIIEQVGQVTMLRVVMPWMIGRAFRKVGDPSFLTILAKEEKLPAPVKLFLANPLVPADQRRNLSVGLQGAIGNLFRKYNLFAFTWADLTKNEPRPANTSSLTSFHDEEGAGILKRGSARYQTLVPSYTVMFAFFLVLTAGWLFVAERRQGTLVRLRAAPLTRGQVLLGKMLPIFALSVVQGMFLLVAGRLAFGMSWGPHPWWLLAVVVCTSIAATGLALLIASLATTETQVAVYGSLLVLVLAGVSGCLMPRALMPEQMQQISRATPHAWALDAYAQLLVNPNPDVGLVAQACAALIGFGVLFGAIAWWRLRLD
ncbi:MAG: ABC transporter permease [Gemmataceae bacterium]